MVREMIKIKKYDRKLPSKTARETRAKKGAAAKWRSHYKQKLKETKKRLDYSRWAFSKLNDNVTREQYLTAKKDYEAIKRKLNDL